MPIGLRTALPDHEVATAFEMGWGKLENGELMAAAEAAGFDAMITGDQNLPYQQNLTSRKLTLIVLQTNHWPTIKMNVARIVTAVAAIKPGDYLTVTFDRPALRRRPRPKIPGL